MEFIEKYPKNSDISEVDKLFLLITESNKAAANNKELKAVIEILIARIEK